MTTAANNIVRFSAIRRSNNIVSCVTTWTQDELDTHAAFVNVINNAGLELLDQLETQVRGIMLHALENDAALHQRYRTTQQYGGFLILIAQRRELLQGQEHQEHLESLGFDDNVDDLVNMEFDQLFEMADEVMDEPLDAPWMFDDEMNNIVRFTR